MLNYRDAGTVWVDSATEILQPPKGVPLPWWPKLTNLLGGLRPHELTLLCAPTGAGKTQFLSSLSAQLLTSGVPHFAAPVETGDTDYMARVASALVKYDLNTGAAPSLGKFQEASDLLVNLMKRTPMLISGYDNRVDRDEMLNMLKYQHQQYGIKVALLDNLNFFLQVTSSQFEKAEMDNTIHEFVILSKRLPIHTILVVHPKKTEKGRVESEFDIKGSSTAVQEASNVMLFNRPKPEERRHPSERELIFRKIRKRGFNVGTPIWFTYQGGRIGELK